MAASQYVEAIIEHLLGVEYDHLHQQIKICPHVPKELWGKEVILERLIWPTRARLSLRIKRSDEQTGVISVPIAGALLEGELLISVPVGAKQASAHVQPGGMVEFP